ncbi:MAG: thioredoxin [Leptospiraceae bacterium]|nr:thioredoxin [Leptospiraceae bacterium]MDW8307375.1 thioredoxin [Leptospiraceae bacterium]
MALVEEITEENFQATINNGVVMVDFWAPWCGPCRMVAPVLEELQKELLGKVKIVKLNVDENPTVAMHYGITSIPTLMVFKDGQTVDRVVGAGPKDFYKKILDKYVDTTK